MTNLSKGSEWRRWDLHLHTPKTKLSDGYGSADDVWDRYIDVLETSPVQSFGITDYFCADGYYTLVEKYRTRYPNTSKVFFPNIEFRLSEAISKKDTNPHIHIIFDNDENQCSKEKILKLLLSLKTYAEEHSGAKISCSELKSASQFEAASVSFEELRKALDETFGQSKPYLIVFPAKNDGVRSTDHASPRKVQITDKIDKYSDIFFGDAASRDYFLRVDRYHEGTSLPKPVVAASDAHSFDDLKRLDGNVSGFPPTWIKADLTFRGLTQVCFEPDGRVFIGIEPLVEQRKQYEATKFISELWIDQRTGYNGENGQWFKNVRIPINPELTVIIGNKGSGKSALVDVMGLLGESRQADYFSFLSDNGSNKKFKQKGYAENFEANLVWESADKTSKNLNDDIDITKPETVRYLPQNYFEQLTNEIEIEAFRKEIEDVVFSHVEQTDRMGKSTFSELQDFKTQQSKQETGAFKTKLHELDREISSLEEQSNPLHKKQLQEKLKAKQTELSSLDKAKPKAEPKPSSETPEQKKISEQISRLSQEKSKLQDKGKTLVDQLSAQKNRLQKLVSLLQSVKTLSGNIDIQKAELNLVCEHLGLKIDEIITTKVDYSSISTEINSVQNIIVALERDNSQKFTESFDFSALSSLPDLRAAFKYVSAQIDLEKEKLGSPQRKYQAYLDKLAKWTSQREEIVGNDLVPLPETITYIKKQLKQIEDALPQLISAKISSRRAIVKEIFTSKKQVLDFYTDIKRSVEAKLETVRTTDFSVDINASFVLDRTFSQEFLSHVNKKRKGTFNGVNEPEKHLKALTNETNWNDFDSVYNFFDSVIGAFTHYKGDPLLIKDQVNDVKDFYDFLFSLNYLSSRYELRSAGKNLNELSPGEKGLLLLIFYLQLEKDNTPLIIDQPEDNLDNDSIFAVLAKCFREAKKNRQVILVTHNPNLAVGADAEQVVFVKLQKSENYNFTYEAGAIENPRINEKIVLVLEGSQPAFVKRRLKYQI